jgi:transcriptional regulator with XRE-family HTH domain
MIDDERLYALIGERIRNLREQATPKRMTQAELAASVGLERTSITNIERGSQKVPLHVLYRICIALGATLVELLPSMAEVEEVREVETESFFLGGKAYDTPPLVHKLVQELLNTGTKNGIPHN